MDFVLNVGGTTGKYDTHTCTVMYDPNSRPISAITTGLIAASEDLPQKRPKIWGKSLASA